MKLHENANAFWQTSLDFNAQYCKTHETQHQKEEQIKPKISSKKKKFQNGGKEYTKQKNKGNKKYPKSLFFEKINRNGRSLARWTRKKERRLK